ncbi:hypothetical protein EGH21_04515 [Halomicroarcula sp. F13]|uniref:Rhomboid family intramembrane serine protease n=1 Tax=Haloarcula rubra TaxID=2487747 RepID=A0AAW4PP30_9EURY|nr:hypothetical protein [Halomicroarcula rubra]MBX0322295.1 hypothetical protein [Halomicroarcula rubra]
MHGSDRTASVRRVLWSRATAVDLLLLCSVPAILLAVASLPHATRESLAFEYTAPTLGTALASSFVHLDTAHLLTNLVGYALVVPAAYLPSVLSGDRERFRVAFVSLLLACPVLLPYLNLAVARRGVSLGFSGVLLALYGYLPLALAAYLDRQFGVGPDRKTAPLLFFVGVTVVSVLTLAAVATNPVRVPVRGVVVPVTQVLVATLVGLVAALVLVVALYALSTVDDWRAVVPTLHAATHQSGHFELALVATVVFLAVPVATFPVDPVVNGAVVNLYTHLVGYALGFTGPYVTLEVRRLLFPAADA